MSPLWHSAIPRGLALRIVRLAGLTLPLFLVGLPLSAGNERAGEKSAKAPAAATVPGVTVDWQRGVIEASASAAADLYAASADVARLKAERLARARAEDRLRRALAGMRAEPRLLARVPAGPAALDVSRATVSHIDYGSNGSVVLRISLPLSVLPPPAERDKRAAGPDGGTHGGGPDLGPTAADSHEN